MVYQFTACSLKPYKTLTFSAVLPAEHNESIIRGELDSWLDVSAKQAAPAKRILKPCFTESFNEVHNDSIDDWVATCEAAARAGGQELRAWQGRFQTRQKGARDLVTDADLASQDAIRRVVAAKFPDHLFLGEETAVERVAHRADQLIWVVDPLDGTTNYVHGYPNFAVSVALARGSDILAGVIYDPLRDQCFAAATGKGAWCDGKRLKTSDVANVAEALVAVSLPANVRRDSADLLDFVEAAQAAQAVRRSGSAALNLAHVASGALDAFWATQIHAWDVAAGVLLIREAGGIVTARNGQAFDLWNPHFLAAAGARLHAEMLEVLTEFAPQ